MQYELQNVDFCGPDAPWCYFARAPLRTIDSFARYFDYWHPIEDQQAVIRVIQGRHCETAESLFREWSAALQFPYYFGHNWDAFDECIQDLEWLPATCYIMFVTEVNLVLPQSPNDFDIYIRVLNWAHEQWKIPNRENMDEPTAPFTIVFHAEPESAEVALARIRAAGADPVEARFSDDFITLTTDRS
jgi:RNAse (barnase) inhibitor barstar